jgi:hypothetical protein
MLIAFLLLEMKKIGTSNFLKNKLEERGQVRMTSYQIIERHSDRRQRIQQNNTLFIDGNSQDAGYITFA